MTVESASSIQEIDSNDSIVACGLGFIDSTAFLSQLRDERALSFHGRSVLRYYTLGLDKLLCSRNTVHGLPDADYSS